MVRVSSTVAFARSLWVIPMGFNHMFVSPGGVTECFLAIRVTALMRFCSSAVSQLA